MARDVSVWRPNPPVNRGVERAIERQLDEQMRRMEYIAEIAQKAMDEVSNVSAYGVFKAATTLNSAELLLRAMGDLDPQGQAALKSQQQACLREIDQIARKANGHIVLSVDQVPSKLDDRNDVEKALDRLLGR